VRHGGTADAIDLQVFGFSVFGLIDDRDVPLSPPGELSLKPTPGWSRFYSDTFDDLADRVRLLRFRTLESPRPMTWFEGLEVLVAPGEQISQSVYMSGQYEPSTTSVLRALLHEGDTFVDVGANVGLFTMLASRWVGQTGRVVALEPSRRESARLRDHVTHNSLRNVDMLEVAASDRCGTAVLHVADIGHGGLNTLGDHFMYSTVVEAYTEVVAMMSIDELVKRQGISSVDVIKIDVEGGEHDVVMGARNTITRDMPQIVLEVGGTALEPGHPGRIQIEAFLTALGYAFLAIDGDSGQLRRTRDLMDTCENFLAVTPERLEALDPRIAD
jgi:FkbM family methyltransferase